LWLYAAAALGVSAGQLIAAIKSRLLPFYGELWHGLLFAVQEV